MKRIRIRELRFSGHIIRKGKLEQLALLGKIAGKDQKEDKEMFTCSIFRPQTLTKNRKHLEDMDRVSQSDNQGLEQTRHLRKDESLPQFLLI